MGAAVEFDRVTCHLRRAQGGGSYTAVKDVSLAIGDGEFVSRGGSHGLRQVARCSTSPPGLLQALVRDGCVCSASRSRASTRRAGYMFQSDALMPWRNALANVTAGLEFRGVDAARQAPARRGTGSSASGLAGFEDRYPHQLSGGMRKRTALAQMLILDPQILLMDEPFSALDIQTRQLMENELLELWSANRKSRWCSSPTTWRRRSRSPTAWWCCRRGRTSHPIGEFAIDLPRPRDVAEIRLAPRFIELHDRIWHCDEGGSAEGLRADRATGSTA